MTRLRDDALNEGEEVVDLGLEPPCTSGEGLQSSTALLPQRRQRCAHPRGLLHGLLDNLLRGLLRGLQQRLIQRALKRGFGGR
jgi:hypothetical protein